MNEDRIYPSMVIRSQAEAIELLEKENRELKEKIILLQTSEPMLEFAKQTYKTNWNELKKWLEDEKTKFSQSKYPAEYGLIIGFIMCALEKMNELEGKSE